MNQFGDQTGPQELLCGRIRLGALSALAQWLDSVCASIS